MTAYLRTPPPHLRTSETVRRMTWKWIAALGPACAAGIFLGHIHTLAVLGMSVAGALSAEAAFQPLTPPTGEGKAQLDFSNGSSVWTGLLFALLLPPAAPLWMAALGSFFAVFVGKEIFGGIGAYPFHPVLAGYVFLILNFPWIEAPAFEEGRAVIFAGALAAGGGLLLALKLIQWEVPFLYLSAVFFLSQAGNYDARAFILNPGILLSAFFFITDPGTTPLTRHGRRIFAIAAAFLTLIFAAASGASASAAFAVLTMNAFTPWLDHGMSASRKKL